MFCPKCGAQNNDTANFCKKCGNTFLAKRAERTTSLFSNVIIWLQNQFANRTTKVIGIGFIMMLFLVTFGIRNLRDVFYGEVEQQSAYVNDVTYIEGDNAELSGEYPNLTSIRVLGGDVKLDGFFPVLKTIKMMEGTNEGVGDLRVFTGMTLPQITSLQCAAIYIDNSCDYTTEDLMTIFPNLESVRMVQRQEYIKEDFEWTETILRQIHDTGNIQNMDIEVYHDIEDLYGIWITENDLLTLKFTSDGTVQITDATGKFGFDICTYREADDDTLMLYPETSNKLLNKLSMEVDYMLYGNLLMIEINGTIYNLMKK